MQAGCHADNAAYFALLYVGSQASIVLNLRCVPAYQDNRLRQ